MLGYLGDLEVVIGSDNNIMVMDWVVVNRCLQLLTIKCVSVAIIWNWLLVVSEWVQCGELNQLNQL